VIWQHTYQGPHEVAQQAIAGAMQAECHTRNVRPVRLLSCADNGDEVRIRVLMEPIDIFNDVERVMKCAFWRAQ
jgi:hypothetical protein